MTDASHSRLTAPTSSAKDSTTEAPITRDPMLSPDRLTIARRDVRYVLTSYLLQAQRPLTVRDLVHLIELDGFAIYGRPSKSVSDALRWEVQHGRVRRRSRGVSQATQTIPRTTRTRILRRVHDLQSEARTHRHELVADELAGVADAERRRSAA
jgi:hypothetical protein